MLWCFYFYFHMRSGKSCRDVTSREQEPGSELIPLVLHLLHMAETVHNMRSGIASRCMNEYSSCSLYAVVHIIKCTHKGHA